MARELREKRNEWPKERTSERTNETSFNICFACTRRRCLCWMITWRESSPPMGDIPRVEGAGQVGGRPHSRSIREEEVVEVREELRQLQRFHEDVVRPGVEEAFHVFVLSIARDAQDQRAMKERSSYGRRPAGRGQRRWRWRRRSLRCRCDEGPTVYRPRLRRFLSPKRTTR